MGSPLALPADTPCADGVRFNIKAFLRVVLATGLLALVSVVPAADKIVIPKVGSSCPSGFRSEGGYCIQYAKLPSTHDSRNAYVEKIGSSCPSGYRSDGSGYCIRYAR